MATQVTSKGQVTIPKPVRDHLGVRPGSSVEFAVGADGQIVVRKSGGTTAVSRFERMRGTADTRLTTDEIMRLMRGED